MLHLNTVRKDSVLFDGNTLFRIQTYIFDDSPGMASPRGY